MPFGEKVRAKDTQGTLRRLWVYLRHQRAALLIVTLLVLATSALNLVGPYLLGIAVDDYIIPGDLPGLARISLLMLAVYLLSALLTWFQIYLIASVSQRTIRAIRNDLFTKLQTLSLRYFDQHPHGDLMSRLTNDVENINMVLSESVIQLLSGAITLVGAAALMLWLNPILAIAGLITIPAMMLLFTRWIGGHTRTGFRRQQSSLGTLNGYIEETITAQRVVKAYNREQDALAHFEVA
ncbi:MAG: ABC transporter ATP-binding protein, partial [Caldilineaceae bacterium]|nr:ABC transporter ATP-binding protein [Caldilineaceae bacterium]